MYSKINGKARQWKNEKAPKDQDIATNNQIKVSSACPFSIMQ